MTKETITIDVAPDGSVVIEGHGFKGTECAKATEAFEKALGTVSKKQRKPESVQQAQQTKVVQ